MLPYADFYKTIGIPHYANMTVDSLGMDSKQHCLNSRHFQQHEPVRYEFNEIGYRTVSVDQFQGNEILAIGDSFTLGLGINLKHTWPAQLEQLLDHPVLNFGLNGASNDWMARKTAQLLQWFRPRAIVVHYTFSHRRERPFPDWHDNERTECEPLYSDEENLSNWRLAFDYFDSLSVPVVHSFITDWHGKDIDYAALGPNVVAPVKKIDLARDGFHYGVKTNGQLAQDITSLLVGV